MSETEIAPDSISACHARLGRILGPTVEPIEVIRRVDEHRQYWKPDAVRVVLLAESHVFTPASELRHALKPHPLLPPGLPRGFVRFVYSIGCGENGLLDEPLQTKNGGSPQFWKVLFACTRPVERNEDFAPVLKSGTPSAERRLKNKLAVLVELRDRGVWLVDASLAALYTPGRGKPSLDIVAATIRASWDAHVGDEIRVAKPEAILVVGYVTAHFLRTRLDELAVPWAPIPQPNARLSSAEHFRVFDAYHRVSSDPKQIGAVRAVLGRP